MMLDVYENHPSLPPPPFVAHTFEALGLAEHDADFSELRQTHFSIFESRALATPFQF